MPRNSRCVLPGLAYHVTQRGSNRERVFFSPSDYKMYLALIRDHAADAKARVLTYCLMTNHVHLIVVPEEVDSLAVLFRRVHGRYSQYLNTRRHRSGHLWQARYYSCPLSGNHLWIALRYVEQNPCRAYLAGNPEQYRWSGAEAHLVTGIDTSRVLDMEFWRRAGGTDTWAEMHSAKNSSDSITLLRRCTYAGRPFGEAAFVERLEARFQRVWRRWGLEEMAAAG
ncbi:MAG: transposase [Bryobacteraceae bacterium]|jgi:putative transposase